MSRRHTDRLVQAQRDLKAARDSPNAGNYEGRGHTLVHLLSNVQDFATHPGEF